MSMKFLKTVAGAAVSSLWEKVSGNIVPKDTSANVGVGTDSPVSNLHVASSAGGRIQSTSDSSGHTVSDGLALSMDGVLRGYLWVYENSYMEFATNNTSHMILEADGDLNLKAGNFIVGTAGKGIDFSGAGTAAEILHDYEEGTFTPTLEGSTTNPTASYAWQYGQYIKIGTTCFVVINITANISVVGAGDIQIAGLPFTPATPAARNYSLLSSGNARENNATVITGFKLWQIGSNTTISLQADAAAATYAGVTGAWADFSAYGTYVTT